MKNILVLGSSGLLGSELLSGSYLQKYKVISQSLNSDTDLNIELEDYTQVTKMLDDVKPDVIINLVGLTDVDHCEKFPKEAYKLNVKTVENLVFAIQKSSNKPFLVHISTDQVYNSEGFCSEKNINPSNYYAFSKYCGELLASKISSTILRTNFFGKSKILHRKSLTDWLYDEFNLGNTINVFKDVWFNPLSMFNLCKMIELVVEKKNKGIFNLGSNDGFNKADFALHFAKSLKFPTLKLKQIEISKANYLYAFRPKNMMMDVSKFEYKFNVKLPKLINEIKLTAKDYQND